MNKTYSFMYANLARNDPPEKLNTITTEKIDHL